MVQSEKFKCPLLSEVAFQISFHPKLKVNDSISRFQEELVDSYPRLEREPIPLDESNILYTFNTRTGERFVRIAINNFNLVEKKYESFKSFSAETMRLWNLFVEHIGKVAIERIGLRYVNRLYLPFTKGSKTSDFINNYYSEEKLIIEELQLLKQESLVFRKDRYLTIRAGIAGKIIKDKKQHIVYILDYDCFRNEDQVSNDISKHLDELHKTIEEQFLSDVGERVLSYMRSGTWE